MIQGAVILRSVFNRLRPGHAAAMEYAFRQNVRESARARMHAVRQEKRRLLSSRSAQDRSNPESSRDSLENPGTSGESELPNDEEEPRPDHISKDGEWIAIYRFRSIMPISLISQLKIAMSGLICVLCPYTAYMALMEERLDLLVESCGLTIATIIALIIFTNITRRLIGVIAVNRDLSSIRVGYLNFWGLRRNTIVPINDVLSLADTDPDIIGAMDSRKFAVRFQRSGAHENLYLPIYNTQIPEPELFEQVFGMQLPPECQQKMGLLRSLIALMSGDTPNRWKEKAE